MNLKLKSTILLTTLFLTSFSSLVYELVWSRQLSFIFGTSALATSTVLTVFMTGLAFGSLYAGGLIERVKKPYKSLAYMELIIGLSCLATLFLFGTLNYVYLFLFQLFGKVNILFNIIQFFLSALLLIIPTFSIGAIFPIIVKLYFLESKKIDKSVSNCYMINNIAGSIGILFVGFFAIWSIGFFNTSLLASIINLFLSLVILIFFGNQEITISKTKKNKEQIIQKGLLILFFFSGFAALVLENVWIRFFDLIYGNSILSFSIVVSTFLMGLGIGSSLSEDLIQKMKNKIFLFSLIELLIGISSLVILLVFPHLEGIFLKMFYNIYDYTLFNFSLGLFSFLVLITPTTLMGMTLPVLSNVYINKKTIGSDIGRLIFANSLGCIFGSFLTAFIFMYFLGLNVTSIFASAVYIFIAISFILLYSRVMFKKIFYISILLLVFVSVLFWLFYQPDFFYGGVYYHGASYLGNYQLYKNATNIIFEKQSPYSMVSVVDYQNETFLKLNGRSEASSEGDQPNQHLLAHLPLLFHNNPKKVLEVGFGAGHTLNAITMHSVESIDTIEIDEVVIEASEYIDDNEGPLSDSRVNLIIVDGRNYLLNTDEKYDVIITEPSHIWACPTLFTKEFIELVKYRLNEDGIYSMWLPFYEMSDEDYTIIKNTVKTVFPYIEEFKVKGDVIIIASGYEINIQEDIHIERLNIPRVDQDLDSLKKILEYEKLTHFDFINRLNKDAERYLLVYSVDTDKINTDDLPILEFTTIRNRYEKFRIE